MVGLATISTQSLPVAESAAEIVQTRLTIFNGYVGVAIASFLVTLIITPLVRRLAVSQGIVDFPSDPRKVHRIPVAYLGGLAVYLGILAGILAGFLGFAYGGFVEFHQSQFAWDDRWPVPLSVIGGMTIITLVGVYDDVAHISPRVKIGGQLIAAGALAYEYVGVRLAAGVLVPLAKALGIPVVDNAAGYETLMLQIPLPVSVMGMDAIPIDIVYWVGTAIIGFSIVALCNASNLIDGLDGLLSGTTAISATALLFIALGMALTDDGDRDAQRIILCMAVLGACLGFLPHNFSPASIFLGDAGSLLLGFVMCVIILMLGDTGKTHLVLAGLIVYMLPMLDTMLAIVRRKMEGKAISDADDQHIHHLLKRALGVKGAVFALYVMTALFGLLGATLAQSRARVVWLLTMIIISYVGVTAIKISRRRHIEAQAALPRPAPITDGPPPGLPQPAAQTAPTRAAS